LGVNGTHLLFKELTLHIHEDFDLEIREEENRHHQINIEVEKRVIVGNFAGWQIQLLRHLGICRAFCKRVFLR